MPTTYPYRIKFKQDTIANFAAAQYDGLLGLVSDHPLGSVLGFYNGVTWRYTLAMDVDGKANVAELRCGGGATIVNDTGVYTSAGVFDSITLNGQAQKSKSFACIYMTGEGTTAQSIPSGAGWTKITPFNANMAGNIGSTPDQANDRITVNRAGIYMVGFTRAYSVGTANVVWHVGIGVNGTVQDQSVLSVKTASTATQTYADLDVPVSCPAGAQIEVYVKHDQGSAVNLTYEHATLYAQAID